jgi:tape measure domain-containing protein
MATDVTQLLIKVNSSQVATASDRVDKLGRSANRTTTATDKLTRAFARFVGPVAAVYAVIKTTNAIVKTGMAFEVFEKQLYAVTGTAKLASAELDYLTDVADRNAVKLTTSIKPYVRLKESMSRLGLEAGTTRDLFEGVSNAAATFGLSADEVNGILFAFSQVASKGTVQAEELKNQIGERIPGAFALAAEAVGKTTAELQKMLETGQLTSKEFLPVFANLMKQEFGSNLERKTDTLAASATRAANAFDILAKEIFEFSADTIGQFVSIKYIVDSIASGANHISDAIRFLKESYETEAFVRLAEDMGNINAQLIIFGDNAKLMRENKFDDLIKEFEDLNAGMDFDDYKNALVAVELQIFRNEKALRALNNITADHSKEQAVEKIHLQERNKILMEYVVQLQAIGAEKKAAAAEGAIDIGETSLIEKSPALVRLENYLNAEWEARDAAFVEEELQLQDKQARELELLKKSFEDKMLLDSEYNDLKKKSAAKLDKDMTDLARREALSSQRQQLQGYNQLLGMTGDITAQLQSMAEEGSSAQKALFFASKGIAIAQAIINTELAATRAMAEYPAPGNIGMSSAIRALGYTSVGLMLGQTIAQGSSGSFAEGGIIPGGSFNSDNLTASVNSGEMILNFAQQKELLDMAKGGGRSSGGGVNVNVINNSGSEIDVQENEGKNGQRMIEIIVSKVEKNIASKVQQGGNMFSKSFEGAYGLKRGNS